MSKVLKFCNINHANFEERTQLFKKQYYLFSMNILKNIAKGEKK